MELNKCGIRLESKSLAEARIDLAVLGPPQDTMSAVFSRSVTRMRADGIWLGIDVRASSRSSGPIGLRDDFGFVLMFIAAPKGQIKSLGNWQLDSPGLSSDASPVTDVHVAFTKIPLRNCLDAPPLIE